LTVRTKADLLERKAMFHEDMESLLSEFKGTMSAFYRSKAYKQLFTTYMDELADISVGKLQLNSPEPIKAKTPSLPAAPSGKKVRDIEGAAKKLG
jgi:hypothetical protein